MKLYIDLSELYRALKKMEIQSLPNFDLSNFTATPEVDIDIQLNKGIELTLDEITFSKETGLATYYGRQVLLYIKDHGYKVHDAADNGQKGNRFHVTNCRTLKDMKLKGRFDRYIVTNNLSGAFSISGFTQANNKEVFLNAELCICKNCLSTLNYKGYSCNFGSTKDNIFHEFNIKEFFEKYSSCFSYPPQYNDTSSSIYTSDWEQISLKTRKERNYTCEYCHINLMEHPKILHAHHINGVKNDNKVENLRVLCADCHKKQPFHVTMYISHQDTKLINRLRKEQGKMHFADWNDVEKYADTALNGVIAYCKKLRLPIPHIAYPVSNGVLELAWPRTGIGIALNSADIEAAKQERWQVWTVSDVLDDLERFSKKIR
jgi:hypothetical protein